MFRCNSVTVGEGAIFRDCRGIGRMGVICKVCIVGYSASGECGGGRGSGVKDRGRREGKGKERRREQKGCKSGYNRNTCTPMFIAGIIAKLWKLHWYPSLDEEIKKVYMYVKWSINQ
jgi:hypothetical protein